MRYRRIFLPGGTFFFTLVTYHRIPLFAHEENVALLRSAFQYVMRNHPFEIIASVILPDHLHMIWKLPESEHDYPMRWRLIKSDFSRHIDEKYQSKPDEIRQRKKEQAVWQRRYWEHLIRDETDLQRHVEYVHYNPVKHGLVTSPVDWKYSSFHKYVSEGLYAANWGAADIPPIDSDIGME